MLSPAIHPHDHAVVIGIRRYADVAAGWISTLKGPDNDAAEVAAWLRDPAGGGLLDDNVRELVSAKAPDPFADGSAEPHQRMVMSILDSIAELPKNAFGGQWAGRRLYVYVSGHGWANRRDEAALVTAEATEASPLNVLVTSWIELMTQTAPFQELVFWGDACGVRVPFTRLFRCTLPEKFSMNSPSVRVFSAYAAVAGLVAVENEMPDGQWHGAFTYALLQGLKGGAATPVTSDTLRDYLLNAMRSFMSDDDRERRSSVAMEPTFGFTDRMEFGSPAARLFPVTLRFPAEAVGQPARVALSRTTPAVAETVLTTRDWKMDLAAGAYAVFVDATSTAHMFQVVGGGADDRIDVG